MPTSFQGDGNKEGGSASRGGSGGTGGGTGGPGGKEMWIADQDGTQVSW